MPKVANLIAALTALLSLILPTTNAAAEPIIIHCGHLIAVPGEPPQTEMSLIIVENKVDSIVKGYATPAKHLSDQVRIIDLKDSWVVPGLIDCHTHLTGQYVPAFERMRRRCRRPTRMNSPISWFCSLVLSRTFSRTAIWKNLSDCNPPIRPSAR